MLPSVNSTPATVGVITATSFALYGPPPSVIHCADVYSIPFPTNEKSADSHAAASVVAPATAPAFVVRPTAISQGMQLPRCASPQYPTGQVE